MVDAIHAHDVFRRYERRSPRSAKEEKSAGYGRQWMGCSVCCDFSEFRSCEVDNRCGVACRRRYDSRSRNRYAEERQCQRLEYGVHEARWQSGDAGVEVWRKTGRSLGTSTPDGSLACTSVTIQLQHHFVYLSQQLRSTSIPTWHQSYTRDRSLVVHMRKDHVWGGGLPDAHTHLHQSEPFTYIEPSGPLL